MNFKFSGKKNSLNYCILINSSPYGVQNSFSALRFTQSLILEKHFLKSVFFYSEGVYNANFAVLQDKNEINFIKEWKKIKKISGCQLNICISSGNKRGIFDKKTIKYLKNFHVNLDDDFNLTSLVDFSKSVFFCDRLIQF